MKRLWMLGLGAMLLPLSGCNRRMEWSPVDMWNRSRYKPLEPEPFFANGSSSQAPVPGTVARGQLRIDEPLYQGRVAGSGVAPLTVQSDGTNLSSITSARGGNTTAGTNAAMNATGAAGRGAGGTDLPVGDNGLGTSPTLVTSFPFPVTYSVLKRGEERFNTYCSPCHSRVGDGHGMIVERGFPKPPSFHIERLRRAPVGHYFDVITNGYGAMYPYANRIDVRDRWAVIAYVRLLQSRSAQNATPEFKKAQTEGGPGLPIFKGAGPAFLPRNMTNERTKNSEHNPHQSMQTPNLIDNPAHNSPVGHNGLGGVKESGNNIEHEGVKPAAGGAH